jgi:diaminopimelate decarboxylase
MKPMGTIPPGFGINGSMMTIGGHRCDDLIARAGSTPLFVYDMNLIRDRVAALRSALPNSVGLHYAIKANPLAELVRAMVGLVDGLDVASVGEMRTALASGGDPGHISFAGPGKQDHELRGAIEAGVTLNLESEGEATRAIRIAETLGIAPRLAVRVNPDFDLKGSGMRMGGGAKPFGVDAERVPALVRLILDGGGIWRGFHIFAGSQALDAAALVETQSQTVALAARLAEKVGIAPPFVNLGGGFGVPYFPNDKPVDLTHIGTQLHETLERRSSILRGSTEFVIELGRYLVAEAGVYLTQIIDRKVSHGEVFLVTDGGLHHQLAASGNFGTVVRRNYPLAIANRFDGTATETASVVGCLCTPLDRLGDQVGLPKAEVADIVAVFMAGAYGASASPAAFLGHPAAVELLVNGPDNQG